MKTLAATFFLVAFLLGSNASVAAAPGGEPRDWLERMAAAMSQMSYQGTFVYVQGDTVETMRITHVADGHGVRERLVSVSGEPREVLRDSNGIRWVLANDQSVLEDAPFNRSFFPELPFGQLQTESSYSLGMGPQSRIAGHQARNIKILPNDDYRYGYSLWLEERSGLLLKWALIDRKRNALAKLVFTDLRLGSEVDKQELKPDGHQQKFKTIESSLPAGRGSTNMAPRWLPANLPPGFELTAHRYFGQQEEGIYEHLIYSDGLAAVSVYVESSASDNGKEAGLSRLGTTHTFSRTSNGMLITVVGDVPAATVKLIAEAVGPVSR